METRPPEKRLEMAPFTVQVTRGLLREPKMRRIMMAVSIALAAVLLVIGLAGLRSWLEPHEHPWRFILFWLSCGWITVTALLLALLDMLLVRAAAKRSRKALHEQAQVAIKPPEE